MSFRRAATITTAAAGNLLRQPSTLSRTIPTRNFAHLSFQPRPQLQPYRRIRNIPIRNSTSSSDPPSSSTDYDYEQMKAMSESPSADRVIIDVREPSELEEAGKIATARNLPIRSQPDALFLPDDEFEERFGFAKPSKEQEVVFYCRAGVRATAAARLALQEGYARVGEYKGSWLDWEKKGGKISKA